MTTRAGYKRSRRWSCSIECPLVGSLSFWTSRWQAIIILQTNSNQIGVVFHHRIISQILGKYKGLKMRENGLIISSSNEV
jgi:hypothetical protein